jgi:cell division protease FtsH
VALLEKETLLKDEIEILFAKVRKVKPRPAWTGSPLRIPSDKPPVTVVAKEEIAAEKPVRKTRKKASPSSE